MTTTAAVAAGLLSGSAGDDELPIAEVAVRTGLSKDMLRYCEKIRLIETVDRSSPTLHPP